MNGKAIDKLCNRIFAAMVLFILVMLIATGCSIEGSSSKDKDEVKVFLHQTMSDWNDVRSHTIFAVKRIKLDSNMADDGTLDTKKYREAVESETDYAQHEIDKFGRQQMPNITYMKGDYADVTKIVTDAHSHMATAMRENQQLLTCVFLTETYNNHVDKINSNLDAFSDDLAKLNKIYGFDVENEIRNIR